MFQKDEQIRQGVSKVDNNANRCNRCILPESFPGLTFDESGICNKCREHARKWGNLDFEKSEKALRSIFETAKRKKGEYDCIVGLSGGKDSSYVVYLCVKEYGLNPLCVTFDNGFLSTEASENIRRLVEKLNVAHILNEPDWELMKRLYRHFLLTAGEVCTPCNVGINSFLYNMANKYRVPMIISGYSAYTDSEPDNNIYHVSTEYFENVVKGHFTKNELEDFLHSRMLARGMYHLTGKIKHIQMPRYVKWDEREIISVLNREIGWEVDSAVSTSQPIEHTDCIAACLKQYLRIKKYGFSENTQKFSALIRNGFMTREEALAKAESLESGIEEDKSGRIPRLMQMLDLSMEDLAEAVKKRQGPYIPKSTKLVDKFIIRNELLMRKLVYRY